MSDDTQDRRRTPHADREPPVSFRCPQPLRQRLETAAQAKDLSRSAVIVLSLRRYLRSER